MKINKFDQKGFTITMELEDEYSVINSFMDESFKELAKDAKVPGFRQGKVPKDVFVKNYGEGSMIERSANKAMNKVYQLAIEEKKIFPVDYPRNIEIKKMDKEKGFVFSIEVDVKPEVKLGKYKGIKAEKKEATVSDEDVNKQMEGLRENYAEYELVENRAAKEEDIVSYDVKASIEDKPFDKLTKKNSGTKIGMKALSEEFDKELIGMKPGDAKNFEIEFKQDHFDKDLASKKVKFEVLYNEVREKKLPELNDELVQKASPHKTVAELKKDIKEKMQKQANEQNEAQFKDALLKEVINGTELDVPQGMVEAEIDRMLRNMEYSLAQSKTNLADYLKMIGKDEKGMREEYKERAKDRAKLNLILEAIAEKEEIKATDKELDAEITKIAQGIKGQDIEESKKKVSEQTKEYVRHYLKDEKTIDFLINHAKITKKA